MLYSAYSFSIMNLCYFDRFPDTDEVAKVMGGNKSDTNMVQQLGGSRPDVQEVDEALPDTISSFDEMDAFNDRLLEGISW